MTDATTAGATRTNATATGANAGTRETATNATSQVAEESPTKIAETVPTTWDPFQIMDRLDEEALRKELEGIPTGELVYVVKEGGTEVVGLSKAGVDECCMMLVGQGQVIREEDLQYELIGEGESREALFKVKASRFSISPTGSEARLDQVIGVKRQPLYFEGTELDLDSRVPGKKYKGKTYRDLLATTDGREFLGWMSENFKEPEIREFARRILAGDEIVAQRGKQLNAHWYESGAMKAARNARFRLLPMSVRQQVIGRARQEGQELVVDKTQKPAAQAAGASATRNRAQEPAPKFEPEPVPVSGSAAPTDKQAAFFQRLIASPVFTEEERRRGLEWLSTKATRQSIKDQIDWLKYQVETR
jgi:hypothetical protein